MLHYFERHTLSIYTNVSQGRVFLTILSHLKSKVFKNTLAVHEFLGAHSCCSEHCKASVVKFLRLHVGKVGWVGWLQAHRIKLNVTGVVVVTKFEESIWTRFDPAYVSTPCLGKVNGEEERPQDVRRNFRDLIIRDSVVDVHAVSDGWRTFADKISNSSHHSNT